jgi:antitoxin ParD1/3/4
MNTGGDMANTSLTLGKHWEDYIRKQVNSGRYGSVSELVRASLRLLEERETQLESLRSALIDGEASGDAGKLDMEAIKQKAREHAPNKHGSGNRKATTR